MAAIWGNVAVARVLLDAGASINVANQFGATPLHFAAQNKRVEMAKLLLEYGADTQARGGNGDVRPYEMAEGELRALLGSLFPGTTSAAGRRPVAIERLQTGVVVPLSSAAKFPSVMDDGNWDLLVSRETDVRTEKKILMGFIEDMTAHAFLTPDLWPATTGQRDPADEHSEFLSTFKAVTA